MQGLRIQLSSDAWKVLNGLVCVYKPAGVEQESLQSQIKRNLAEDLNCMKRSVTVKQGMVAPPVNYIHLL